MTEPPFIGRILLRIRFMAIGGINMMSMMTMMRAFSRPYEGGHASIYLYMIEVIAATVAETVNACRLW